MKMIVFDAASPPDRTWHKVNDPKADYSGDLAGAGRAWAEARTLLVCAAHRPTTCNVGLMSQAVSWSQIWVQARMPSYSFN